PGPSILSDPFEVPPISKISFERVMTANPCAKTMVSSAGLLFAAVTASRKVHVPSQIPSPPSWSRFTVNVAGVGVAVVQAYFSVVGGVLTYKALSSTPPIPPPCSAVVDGRGCQRSLTGSQATTLGSDPPTTTSWPWNATVDPIEAIFACGRSAIAASLHVFAEGSYLSVVAVGIEVT